MKDKENKSKKQTGKLLKGVVSASLILFTAFNTSCDKSLQQRKGDGYTLCQYVLVSPDSWNVHNWENAGEAMVLSYTEMGLVSAVMKQNGEYQWQYEMADDIRDITQSADSEERARWNVTEQSGRIFEISLNKNAVWEDGEKINADTYIYSMQQLLSPKMKNSRADVYLNGQNAIYNAEKWNRGQVQWSDVGFYKRDDYTLIYVTASAQTLFGLLCQLQSNFIVKPNLYNEYMTEQSGLTVTAYGSGLSSYASYGPYKLVGFEKDKQLLFTRNPTWYGWSDGKHKDQFMATDINVRVIKSTETAMQMFLKGELDSVNVSGAHLDVYKASEYLLHTPQTYTMRFSFNTDLEVLQRLERERNDSKNVAMLSLTDFRRAISYSIDRASWCSDVAASERPQVALLSDLYYYDIENGTDSVYRYSNQAMQAITDLYQIKYGDGERYKTVKEAYQAVSGYDLQKARRLFQDAYLQGTQSGIYKRGQEIVIHIGVSSTSKTGELAEQENKFNLFLKEATMGTELEEKVRVKYIYDLPDRYGDTANGAREGCYGGLGGAAFDPYRALDSYIDEEKAVGGRITEGSFNSKEIYIDIPLQIDGETRVIRKSLYAWSEALDGELLHAPSDVKLSVLAQMEKCILSCAHCIPVTVTGSAELISRKISYGADSYNIMYGYGGIRHIKFNYSDREWDKYVSQCGGTLDYR